MHKKISIIHPSRGRAEQAQKTQQAWMEGTTDIEYLLTVDLSDPTREQYSKLFHVSNLLIGDNHNVVAAANYAAKVVTGDIIIQISDDFEPFKGWDEEIRNVYKTERNKLLKTYDGMQRWIVTLPIMDREFYEHNGYIYHPAYEHMFCDTDLTHKADIEKLLIIRNDIKFTHNHYMAGGQKKDAINERADSTWAKGEETYKQRIKERFGLKNELDILSLSEEAKGHINWLKAKQWF